VSSDIKNIPHSCIMSLIYIYLVSISKSKVSLSAVMSQQLNSNQGKSDLILKIILIINQLFIIILCAVWTLQSSFLANPPHQVLGLKHKIDLTPRGFACIAAPHHSWENASCIIIVYIHYTAASTTHRSHRQRQSANFMSHESQHQVNK